MGLRKTPRFLVLTLGYTALLQASYLAALMLRFEGDVPSRFWAGYLQLAPAFTLLSLVGLYVSGLYHGLWRYASTVTLFQIFKGVTLSALALVIITLFTLEPLFPRSLIVMVWLWELVLLGGVRFAWRLSRERIFGPMPLRAGRALVIGADHTGVHLIQEMRRGPAGHELLHPIGFIDDDARLTGHLVEGVKVFGTIADLPRVLHEQRAELVIISDPNVPAKVVREIARFCDEASVRVMTLPGLSDLRQGRTALSQMRDMRIEDLLGRQPVQLNLAEVAEFLRQQRILVTGAGGSIGSELARQVVAYDPASLVLLDHSENGLYYVHNELSTQHPSLPVHAVVADIKDAQGIESVFEHYRPTVVFHAAAHKHVPLLETNPREAVLNNIIGTHTLVQAADRHGVGKFVLISTDKAVNPTSVMGASKRVCEMLLQSRSQHSHTRFAAVRFGNVLGSDGSVIPLFQRQLQRGGPLTVTHPDARRFFMTIPEAVRLVLQAGAMGRGGEVFLLDMGEQVRIVDLARQLIRMSGLREGEDIEIVYTGLRPGEKLYEELHSDAERMRITRHERILVWDLDARDEEGLIAEMRELEGVAHTGDVEAIKRQLHRLVPEYIEPHHDPMPPPVPDAVLVELPAAAPGKPLVPRRSTDEVSRGILDAVAAAVLLALSWPLWALIWLEVRRAGAREMFVRAVHVGRTRRWHDRRVVRDLAPIDRRSMDRRTQDLLGSPIACKTFRVDLGPVGRWAARHRLDRIPRLLNVLGGDMALVGPKPELQDFVLRHRNMALEYDRRFSVLPGVTGLAQVAGCTDDGADGITRRIQYDLYYIDHRSLLLDVRTLFRTVRVLFGRAPGGRRGLGVAPHGSSGTAESSLPASARNGSYVANGYTTAAPPAVKGVSQ
jgi:FlaA1/EpsC-like NDP-sugar epimerase/lipopolysaccharide/colanic/teichoic acid biosynthesis glycosyltransferase